MSYKIGVTGDHDSIMLFSMFGFETFPTNNPKEARKFIDTMAETGYGVIYVTEQIAKDIPETINRYNDKPIPVIILIPNQEGSLGIGLSNIVNTVEKAVGQNIL